ncbi:MULTISPECIES: D-alanyl-D-alanine carboxypeptidase family protein [Streptomyces]|uniref:Serine hydrolase n=2 Tax=Streptomyces chilikensis TaxID=1194079 RepID=A0ABV3EIA1_9ACTN|nr:serine hydrolase [Streptomyces sp. MJP52]MDH6228545.1 D-alanyl-D-alanine carboxypeptidase (penicillin-binding protein 5/6) [Streptomyces sp. MJP52]
MKIAFFSRGSGSGSGRAVRLAVAGCALFAVGASGTPAPVTGPPDPLLTPGTQVRPAAGAPEVPEVSALSWVVADARSGDVLAAHDAHRRLPPASTLKTLFALALLPRVPEGRHRATGAELAGVGEGSSLVGVEAGRDYAVDDLWRGVFLSSGNDAVHVLSAMAGGTRAAVARMQDTARKLGARDTRVVSPDGYDAPGQVSSAYDLAVFGRAGLRDPRFTKYCRTAAARFPGRGGVYDIRNTNRLLTGADGVEPYPGAVGVKNGYTSKAGHTLIAAARRGGRTLVVTVLNPQDGGSTTVYEEARSLLDWGFRAAGRVRPVGSLEPPVAAGPPSSPRPRPSAEHAAAEVAGRGEGGGTTWRTVALAGCAAALAAAGTAFGTRRGRRGRAVQGAED